MFDIILSDKAKQQLEITERNSQKKIILALERIRIRPESFVKKLVGYQGFKFKVGNHRLILDIHKGNIFVLTIKKKIF